MRTPGTRARIGHAVLTPERIAAAILIVFCASWLSACGCEEDGKVSAQRDLYDDGPDGLPVDDVLDINGVRFATVREGMAIVPAGVAVYGCDHEFDAACGDEEKDLTVVYHSAFLIDVREASWSEYRACVQAEACDENDCLPETDSESDALPAACVTFDQAAEYCAFADKRIPHEAEWEAAARGLNGNSYPWGSEWCTTCLNWSDDGQFDGSLDGYAGAAAVDAFPDGASPYGVLNMSGNLWEWADGRAIGDAQGDVIRVIRGGGYTYPEELATGDASEVYLAYRRFPVDDAELAVEYVGFRCTADPEYE